MLSIKVIPPIFRCLKNGALVMDNNKKGRILLEWSPRGDGGTSSLLLHGHVWHGLAFVLRMYETSTSRTITHACALALTRFVSFSKKKIEKILHTVGGFNRDAQIRFGLSPEEAGFLLHQLPDNVVEFVRRTPSDSTTSGSVAADLPEKVLRITPGEGGQFSFKVDYEKDGVGGQTVVGSDAPLGPLEVVAQLGEYVVIMELIKCSLPSLTGWDVQLNLAMQNSVNIAVRSSTGNFDSGGYSRPVTQKADDSDLPF